MPNPTLTRDGFRAWLESKEPGSRVGVSYSPCNCPIANYLNATYAEGRGEWDVDDEECRNPYSIKGFDTPDWASRFIRRVDTASVTHITARRALAILGEGEG